MGVDLEDRATECLDLEEEPEIAEGPAHFTGETISKLADLLPSYLSTKFISALTKNGIPINSHYSELSPSQAALLDKIYERCEDIIINEEAREEQSYFNSSGALV